MILQTSVRLQPHSLHKKIINQIIRFHEKHTWIHRCHQLRCCVRSFSVSETLVSTRRSIRCLEVFSKNSPPKHSRFSNSHKWVSSVCSFIKSPSTFGIVATLKNPIHFHFCFHFTVGCSRDEFCVFHTLGLKSSDGHFGGHRDDRNNCILHCRVGGEAKTSDERWNDKIVGFNHNAIVKPARKRRWLRLFHNFFIFFSENKWMTENKSFSIIFPSEPWALRSAIRAELGFKFLWILVIYNLCSSENRDDYCWVRISSLQKHVLSALYHFQK